MPDPEPSGGRKCTRCGETFQGEVHINCVEIFKEVFGSGSVPPPEAHLDTMPPEAEAASKDPTLRLGQYILVQQIGQGGMGTVWKAWDTKLTRWTAIKFLRHESPDDLARFQREAKLAARLHHPNITAVYEVGEAPSREPGRRMMPYIAMQYIDGKPAGALTLPIRGWIQVFVKVARAVEAAHKAGVVHRDLKPNNVMLTSESWPYVMDFGLAKPLGIMGSLSSTGLVLGTPAYMSPEQAQARTEEIDERSDVYSLGATLYDLLCRQAPHGGLTTIEILSSVLKKQVTPPRELNPEIPPEIETIVLKTMSAERADRYASAAEFADDLERFLDDQDIVARRPRTIRRLVRHVRHRAWAYALVAIAVAAGALLVQRVTRKPSDLALRWKEHVDHARYRGALELLEKEGGVLPAEQRERYARETADLCAKDLNRRTERFCRGLAEILSRGADPVSAPPALRVDPELILPHPALTWTQKLTERLGGPLGPLLDLAEEAVAMDREGENGWFRAAEEAAFRRILVEVRDAAVKARDLVRADRERLRAGLEPALGRWKKFTGTLDPAFHSRHPSIAGHATRLEEALKGFPEDLRLDDVNIRSLLNADSPEARLRDLQERLEELEKAGRNPSVESRRRLYALLVTAVALRCALEGKSEAEAAKELEPWAPKLQKVGGPEDPKEFGPAVEKVFATLLEAK